jgi:hypothetical protein
VNHAPRLAGGVAPTTFAIGATFFIALAIYIRTLLPGPSFGDWAEMQWLPSVFGIPHPTGYPLYLLIARLFSLVPIGSLAYRADLLSAVTASAAAATGSAIAIRLEVRPLIAALLGVTLALTSTFWTAGTIAEVNALHVLLVALLIHRALVWRAERRPHDLRLAALIGGLSLANHALAVSVVPIVAIFLAWDARHELWQHKLLAPQCLLLGCVGPALYAVIPLRALAGPAAIYGPLLTWDGFSSLVTGAQFRQDMHFGSPQSLHAVATALPGLAQLLVEGSTLVLIIAAGVGALLLLLRGAWVGALFLVLVALNVYLFANYVGDLDHYLLLTWLLVCVSAAVALEGLMRVVIRLNARWWPIQLLVVLVPVAVGASNWTTHDLSEDRQGDVLVDQVFEALPQNAVLLTYWDALTALSYAHCIGHDRPDVALRAYDPHARVTCDDDTEPLAEVARDRPVFALFAVPGELDPLRASYILEPGPTFALPYGHRSADRTGTLYRLVPRDESP